MIRVLLTGAGGQLGWELQRRCPENIELFAFTSGELDIRDEAAVLATTNKIRPDIIINAAAYTAVDKAESERELAFAVNADGAAHLALAAKEVGARLVQVSTDYVFDGSNSSPYLPNDATSPLGVYGESKYQGELRVQEILPNDSVILRTSWVYSSHGNNFVKSMLRLMSDPARDELGVVADQVGSPSYAGYLADAVFELAQISDVTGIFNWTDAGVASWYDFAQAIMEEGIAQGLLSRPISLKPIRTCDYPTPAKRPAYSVLDKTGIWEKLSKAPRHWRVSLREMITELASTPN